MKKRASQKNMTRKTALYTEVSFYAPSRFPGLQHKSAFPSRIKCNGYESSITEYSDRIVQDSHLIPSSENECDCSSCKHSQISCRSFFSNILSYFKFSTLHIYSFKYYHYISASCQSKDIFLTIFLIILLPLCLLQISVYGKFY